MGAVQSGLRYGLRRVAFGVVGALVLLELFVRVLDVPPRPLDPLPIPSYRLSANPVLGYEYRPGYRSSEEPFDADHAGYEINAAGLRDRDYSLAKPPGVYRVIVLGDSTTAGNGIPDVERTYTKVLERLLDERAGEGQRFEVLNFGVGGYHPVQEVELLAERGLAYDPDLVIVTFCQNDFHVQGALVVLQRLRSANGLAAPPVAGGLLARVTGASRLAFVVYHRLAALSAAGGGLRDWYERSYLQGASPVEVGYARLARLRAAGGFRAWVAVLPDFDQSFERYAAADNHARVREVVEGCAGLELLDLLEGFAGLGLGVDELSLDGQHLSERGHLELARLLVPHVLAAAAQVGR